MSLTDVSKSRVIKVNCCKTKSIIYQLTDSKLTDKIFIATSSKPVTNYFASSKAVQLPKIVSSPARHRNALGQLRKQQNFNPLKNRPKALFIQPTKLFTKGVQSHPGLIDLSAVV